MPQTEQTNNGDYEFILKEHTFEGVGYARRISWTAGSGKVIISGSNTITRTISTDSTEANGILDAWDSITVENTNFRLVKTIIN
ncbi:hypothetical protein BTUL_0349g00060 [Botrytis tulipae]|uniref:Uncharacterized protein n=1 Tax=Botrytis tulipae TaxID=87230 RepID=A0A4Z1E8E3_9HELO|nr:hypothetical protein BTUL_0349g00060 [Botrytis tulipae]